MPQVRALKTFKASRYGYMVRAGVIFSAETGYAQELAGMGMVTILADALAARPKPHPAGKDQPSGPPTPAPANPSLDTADLTDAGLVKVLRSSRPDRRSRRVTAPLRVVYPTKPLP